MEPLKLDTARRKVMEMCTLGSLPDDTLYNVIHHRRLLLVSIRDNTNVFYQNIGSAQPHSLRSMKQGNNLGNISPPGELREREGRSIATQ